MGVQRDFVYDKAVLLPELQTQIGDMYELADIKGDEAKEKWLSLFTQQPTVWKSGGSVTGRQGEHTSIANGPPRRTYEVPTQISPE